MSYDTPQPYATCGRIDNRFCVILTSLFSACVYDVRICDTKNISAKKISIDVVFHVFAETGFLIVIVYFIFTFGVCQRPTPNVEKKNDIILLMSTFNPCDPMTMKH